MTWILQRRANTSTLGDLTNADKSFACVTLERPWLNNAPNVSCIPAGTYQMQRFHSPKRGYDVFKLVGVPGRSMIELHIGNFEDNTDGCILLGTTVVGPQIIEGSKDAFDGFMAANAGVNSGWLVVNDAA